MNNTFPSFSVSQLLLNHEKNNANSAYLRQPFNGKWRSYTWGEVVCLARQVAHFLLQKGLKPGDHVSICSKNCAEWFIADFGITLAGMVNIPLFPNQHEDTMAYILEHADVQLIFVGKLDNHHQLFKSFPKELPTVNFTYHDDLDTDYQWSDITACTPLKEVVQAKAEDIYTIIYSSGTSGSPKGAVYTHQAIANYLAIFPKDIAQIANIEHYRLLSYLPLAHVYERSALELGSLVIPSEVSFVESLETFAQNVRDVCPNLFAGVPRIFGVFKHKIEQKIPEKYLMLMLKVPLLSKWLQHKIQRQLGLQHACAIISGAAHLPRSIYTFFEKLGIPVLEGYGQTENLAYATVSHHEDNKPGYVGKARLQVELRIGEKHELLMHCPCLMREYYKDPEATEKAFIQNGWLRTGDTAEIDGKGRVKIISRLSDTFKNQKGEFVMPVKIEKQFVSHELIENVCLVGRELPSNILLLTLTQEAKNIPKEQLKETLQSLLHAINPQLKNYEKVSHILIIKEDWTTGNDMLTPTLKVKRRNIEATYQDLIEKSVKNPEPIIWQ